LALLPHLWPKGDPDLKLRVVLSLLCLVLAKVANIYVPILYKHLVDALGPQAGAAGTLPLRMLLAYGAARIAHHAFAELRDGIFATGAQRAIPRRAPH